MSKGGYKIFDQGGLYYVSFAVVAWVDVFTRKEYRGIIIKSLRHSSLRRYYLSFASPHQPLVRAAVRSPDLRPNSIHLLI